MNTTHHTHESPDHGSHAQHGSKSYLRFGAMIFTSTAAMYALMYLNTYSWDHVILSETRLYLALIMGATMAVLMLSFMWKMHPNRWINVGIYAGSLLVFLLALWLVRSQRTVQDVSYMQSMIPHHSVAILASERAQISDPRVQKLADQIIESQRKEIARMKALIQDIQADGTHAGTSGR